MRTRPTPFLVGFEALRKHLMPLSSTYFRSIACAVTLWLDSWPLSCHLRLYPYMLRCPISGIAWAAVYLRSADFALAGHRVNTDSDTVFVPCSELEN